MNGKTAVRVQSPIGHKQVDNNGSAVGTARMNPAEGYGPVPKLLQEYIDTGSEKAWQEIFRRIDNVYATVSSALESLDAEAPFSGEVRKQVESGKKLFFKPNLVVQPTIDFTTHAPHLPESCTPWEFVAAVMRWFHDKRDISYYKMALGEAGTAVTASATMASKIFKTEVTTQAVMEGKCGDNYGGWGFYFARRYLAGCHDPAHTDDPMRGYEESVAGVCLPMGRVNDKLLVYDINKIDDDYSNGRDVPVAGGINFKSITLHKAVVGGDPSDPRDIKDWPGCVLVNPARLKVHNLELFTAALKNLGMGLYPMEVNVSKEPGKYEWKYAAPNLEKPRFKLTVPHSRWVLRVDDNTTLPVPDKNGNPVWERNGGMEANIADAVQAVKGQNIMMLHVVDAIEATNINHSGPGGVQVPEGFVFAGTDPVAVDTCGSRYLFSMVPMNEAESIRKKYKLNSDVLQKVPMPKVDGKNIITGEGYDSPFSRYNGLKHCAGRGLGKRQFYVVGNDLWQGGSLASLNQRLGRVDGGVFTELLTATLYYTPMKVIKDLQATSFAYLAANDKLTGSDYMKQVLEAYDENGDGVIDYLEGGKGGSAIVMAYSMALRTQDIEPSKAIKLAFLLAVAGMRLQRREWNVYGFNLGDNMMLSQSVGRAFQMSQAREEVPDPFFPGRTWGKGKWPSMQFVLHQARFGQLYGQTYPRRFDVVMSPYGQAFRYADMKWNGSRYCTPEAMLKNEDVIGNYHRDVAGGADPLPFTFYVPRGMGSDNQGLIPDVEETDDPALMFTAAFNDGEETWRELRLSEYDLK
jgi:hypothetical protein